MNIPEKSSVDLQSIRSHTVSGVSQHDSTASLPVETQDPLQLAQEEGEQLTIGEDSLQLAPENGTLQDPTKSWHNSEHSEPQGSFQRSPSVFNLTAPSTMPRGYYSMSNISTLSSSYQNIPPTESERKFVLLNRILEIMTQTPQDSNETPLLANGHSRSRLYRAHSYDLLAPTVRVPTAESEKSFEMSEKGESITFDF